MLSFMASEYFQRSPMLIFPVLALALFMLVFFVVTVRTVLTQKERYEGIARLPLADEKSVLAAAAGQNGSSKEQGHV
jgi:hypothetical protein